MVDLVLVETWGLEIFFPDFTSAEASWISNIKALVEIGFVADSF